MSIDALEPCPSWCTDHDGQVHKHVFIAPTDALDAWVVMSKPANPEDVLPTIHIEVSEYGLPAVPEAPLAIGTALIAVAQQLDELLRDEWLRPAGMYA